MSVLENTSQVEGPLDAEAGVKNVLGGIFKMGSGIERLNRSSSLLASIPEFDSMAVVQVMAGLEDQFDIEIEDDEVSADTFETLDSLVSFIEQKLSA
jgi:acyl carrier protein